MTPPSRAPRKPRTRSTFNSYGRIEKGDFYYYINCSGSGLHAEEAKEFAEWILLAAAYLEHHEKKGRG